MTTGNDDKAGVSRRNFLQSSVGAAALAATGSLALPRLAQAAGGLVALVHTQAAGDNGPVDSMIAALKKLSGEKGFQMRAIYAQDAATYETIFKSLADAGASVIAATFNEVAEPMKALAPQYKDTKWIQIFGDPLDPPVPNIVTVSYDYYLGCYLSGMFAAKVSKTGKIGYIGGVSIPPLNADLNAMKAAAASVNATATVTGAFAGSFQDPARAIDRQPDVPVRHRLYPDRLAATDTGIIQAANEGEGRMVSAISPAQYKIGPKTVAALVSLDFGQSLYNEVTKGAGPRLQGRPRPYRPRHRRDRLHTFAGLPGAGTEGPVAKAKEVWPEIEKAKADIISGALKVAFKTEL